MSLLSKFNMNELHATPKKVHYTTMACFLFGIAFCLPHGIVTKEVAPALGLIPLGIGALTALYHISRLPSHKQNAGYQILLPARQEEHRNNNLTWASIILALLDFGCFGGLVVTVAFSILLDNGVKCRYSYRSSMYNGVQHSYSFAKCRNMQPMLAAWATMVMLVNAVIHLYLLVMFVSQLWHYSQKQSENPLCTRCQSVICGEEERFTRKHEDYDEGADQASSSLA